MEGKTYQSGVTERHRAEDVLRESEARLELFFSQSLDGFFFMMLDEPVRWDDTVDKDKVLDYVFSHQRMTKVNDAMLAQYGATREQFLGLTPNDFYEHNLAHGREVWRRFFDAGRLHVETDERKLDGTPMSIEGDYICFYDSEGRITGHFGIQRDVTERKRAEAALRQYNQRLRTLQEIDRAILAARSPAQIAQAALRHIHELVPCLRASVAEFDFTANKAVLIAIHAKTQTKLDVGAEFPLEAFGDIAQLWLGKVRAVEDTEAPSDDPAVARVRAEGVRSFINVPLRAQGELIGAFNVGAERPGRFSDEHIEIAQEVANSLAIAIRQARLYEQIEQHALELEQRVAERTAELSKANASLKNEIAERERIEAELRESEERLRAIAKALPDLLFVLDEEGRHLEVLTSQENLLYVTPENIRGRLLHQIFSKPLADRFLAVVQRTAETHETVTIEYELPIAGVTRCFEARTAPLYQEINGKKCIVWIARDITDRKRADELQSQNVYLQEELRSELRFGEMIGASEAMQKVFRNIEMVAATDSSVLLLGETGTGKELIARAIHNLSRRKDRVMVKVNCGALPAGLVESELFGHEKGAFTGATAQKKGRFELANHGTIFLDEVGELALETQVKLLRVLQEQEFERVGGAATLKVNVRVIAATNRHLEEDVKNGSFRPDLFYRLNIFPIRMPALRERADDIPLLANYLISQFARRLGKRINSINQQALKKLVRYDWPGNVRELANILERAVILCQGRVLQEEHLGELSATSPQPESFVTLEEAERRHILQALEKTNGILAGPKGAAQLLGINRSTLWSRMRKLGINAPAQNLAARK
ncbi:sigma 54-interacting transcriptional regulator [candidate division KSB1 bacterium]|nr:sigma 54-interacting transcriptional regulator [candidate division KSB1 bacterium]